MKWFQAIFLAGLACAFASPAVAAQRGPESTRPAYRASDRVTIAVPLRYRDERSLDELLDVQNDPQSPFFRHFLTSSQFQASFAPTVAAYRDALGTLTGAGFHIDRTYANRSLIVASTSFQSARAFFHVALSAVEGGAGPRFAYAGKLAIAPSLDADEIIGLEPGGNTPRRATAPQRATRSIGPSLVPSGDSQRFYGPSGGFGPPLAAKAYDFPSRHGFDGSGVRAAILVLDAPSIDSDTSTFLKYFNVKPTGPPVQHICPSYGCNSPGAAALETEWLVGLAPGVAVDEYSPCLVPLCVVAAYSDIVSRNNDDVVGESVEFDEVQYAQTTVEVGRLMKQGAALGMTFVDAIGGATSIVPSFASTPADESTAIAVAPADVTTSAQGDFISETVDANTYGGASAVIPMPKYQMAFFDTRGKRRLLPDVTVPLTINGQTPATYDGASWSYFQPFSFAPGDYVTIHGSIAMALVAEYAQMHKGRLGNLTAQLYALAGPKAYKNGLFRDITKGCTNPANGPVQCAKPGWDVVTGIGGLGGYTLGKALQ